MDTDRIHVYVSSPMGGFPNVTSVTSSCKFFRIDFGRGTAQEAERRIHLLRKVYPHESQARPLLARSLHNSCTDIFPCGASSVATSARPRLIACCTTLAYVVSHRPSVTTSPPTPLLDLPLLSQEMGCAGSTAQGSSTSGPGTPGTKQNQASESEKDEAAAMIQGFAATYNTQKKKEKEQDAAAAEIQMQAAAFLKQKQAAAAQANASESAAEKKPKLTLPPAPAQPLAVAAAAAVDAVTQLSHRLFGGAEAPAAAPAAAPATAPTGASPPAAEPETETLPTVS